VPLQVLIDCRGWGEGGGFQARGPPEGTSWACPAASDLPNLRRDPRLIVDSRPLALRDSQRVRRSDKGAPISWGLRNKEALRGLRKATRADQGGGGRGGEKLLVPAVAAAVELR
jgi:hypothetical protein